MYWRLRYLNRVRVTTISINSIWYTCIHRVHACTSTVTEHAGYFVNQNIADLGGNNNNSGNSMSVASAYINNARVLAVNTELNQCMYVTWSMFDDALL